MSITINDHREPAETDVDPDYLCDILDDIYTYLKLPSGEIEFTLTNDEQIQILNWEYRHKPNPTNVLSFPQYTWESPCVCAEKPLLAGSIPDSTLWGEVIVSCETVKKDAMNQESAYFTELVRICIHGILHIFGYNHENDDDYAIMHQIEEEAIVYAIGRMK